MIGFVLKRVAGLAVILLLAAFLVFLVLDLAETSAGAPLWQRFALWTGGALLGDFGVSANGPISALIAGRLMVTAPLAAMAMLLAAAIGLPLGLLAARKAGSPVDRLVTGGMLLFIGLPAFWLGMLMVLVFSAALHWLPSGGFVPWAQDPGGAMASLILPAVALALPSAALVARSARAALIEVQAADFIRTARLKGLTPHQAVWRHGLRNALLPVLASLGPLCAALIAGTVVVENVFYLPGLGRPMLSAIAAGEPAIVRGALGALMVVMAAALLATDLLRAWADPRLRQPGRRLGEVDAGAGRQPGTDKFAMRHPGLRLGIIVSLLFLLVGFVSISWTPYPLGRANVAAQLQDPSLLHWLGTDPLGRDLLSLAMKGTLTSFVVSAVAVAIGLLFGVPLGFAAAAFGQRAAWLAAHASTFTLLFPALAIAVLLTAASGPGAVDAMLAIGIVNIGVFARVTGGGVAQLARRDYVAAARLAGMAGWEVAKRHQLPVIANLVAVQTVVQLALGVLSEAALSYVGLGTQPPGTSLGLMLRETQSFMLFKPLLALVPGIAIVAIVLALNLIADGLGRLIDPSLQRRGVARVTG